MVVLILSYLLLVFVLPVALSGIITYRALPLGRRCPQCGGETLRLRRRALRTMSALHPRVSLQQRWCLCCGWEGVTRLPKQRRRTRAAAAPAAPAAPPPAAAPRRSTQTLDVRSLDVDGTPWRVMLQCWTSTGLFYGRLIFISPKGKLWLDAVEAFNGSDEHEVLGQAQSLPEPLLANRLRRLVSG